MSHVFITGDKHGDYKEVERFCLRWNTSKDDLLIVLGDNGINYWGPHRDKKLKNYIASLPVSFFFIKGNHDQRPSEKLYETVTTDWWNRIHPCLTEGECLIEPEFPSLLFAKMYGYYSFIVDQEKLLTERAFVLGGAYSADKYYRLEMQAMGHSGYRWFPDEQMTQKEMDEAYSILSNPMDYMPPDVILSHTCPFKYIPRDMFMPIIDQSTVDDTMERWMDKVADNAIYFKWYCGHWHTDRTIDKMRFMFHDIIELSL